MPKVYENQRVADWCVAQIRNKIFGRQQRTGAFHISEVYQCYRKTIRHRSSSVEPYDKDAILKFAVGFAMQEFFLGPEDDGDEVWGVIFSPDRIVKSDVLEFKTTRMGYAVYAKDENGKVDKSVPKVRFDPERYEMWTTRTLAYAVANNCRRAHIIVFYLFGNDIHAWTFEYDDEELAQAKRDIETRRDALQERFDAYKETGVLPPVTEAMGSWEHGLCPYLADCAGELQVAGVEAS